MIFLKLLPGVLKELVRHVPTVLFKSVEWSELTSELPIISRRVLQKEGFEELFTKQKELLSPFDIKLTLDSLKNSSVTKDKWTGEKWLTLYFAQLHSPNGLFLDLRSQHFHDVRPVLEWHPTGFWARFSETFRLGILKVYDGFYMDNKELYFEGLIDIGLISPDWPQEDKNQLGELFQTQFGNARTEEMSFNLNHFQQSIFEMSDFLLKKKVKISKDFLYLGIYLVTLYSSLEETKSSLPVKAIYLRVRGQYKD